MFKKYYSKCFLLTSYSEVRKKAHVCLSFFDLLRDPVWAGRRRASLGREEKGGTPFVAQIIKESVFHGAEAHLKKLHDLFRDSVHSELKGRTLQFLAAVYLCM